MNGPMLEAGKADRVEHGADSFVPLSAVNPLHPKPEGDVATDREVGEEGVVLKHESEAALVGGNRL